VPLFQRTLPPDLQYDDAEIYLGWSYLHLGRYPRTPPIISGRRRSVSPAGRVPGKAWAGASTAPASISGRSEVFQEAVALDPVHRDAITGARATQVIPGGMRSHGHRPDAAIC